MLKDGIKQVKVFYYNIIFMKADNNYVEIHTSNKIYIDRNSLENLNDKMQSEDFIRIHRSYIVNKNHIKSLTINEIEIGNQKLPISRNYLPLLKQVFIDTHKS
jgi:DNA-binding LytR/AlgR family response regulator